MERLSKITPGAVFLIVLIVILSSSPEIWSMMYKKINHLLGLLDGQEATVLISLNFIFLIFIVSLIAALSFTIERLWDFIFYSFIFKGYNQKEYELLKDYLLKSIGDDSNFKNEIESMKVQPIYGQFLHSYARQTFVNWLARRWDTFHESTTNSIGIFLAIVSGCGFIYYGEYTYSDMTKFIILIAIFLILIILSVGKKRKKELLMSEKLFCISIVDPDVRLAFQEISEAITERGQNENCIEATLDKRL